MALTFAFNLAGVHRYARTVEAVRILENCRQGMHRINRPHVAQC